MATQASDGRITCRPMSNNGDVEYDGNSYFYTYEESEVVKELSANKNINLSFQGEDMLFISITGKGELIKEKNMIKEHWVNSLNKWFDQGSETPGITMIHVKADTIKYWLKEEQGEVKI